MNLEEYQKLALKTESIISTPIDIDRYEFLHMLNAYIIIGELFDCYKRKIFYKNSKKYDEQFSELAHKLQFISGSLERHNSSEHPLAQLCVDNRFLHSVLGVGTESAELVASLEKYVNGHELDVTNVFEEFGDLQWYGAILHDTLNLNPEETLIKNIEKLSKRYPDKYFNEQHAVNRELDSERKTLEGKS